MCDDIDLLSQRGIKEPCGSVLPEGAAQVLPVTCGAAVGAGGGKEDPDAMATECDLSSSESESVSGGNSSDDDLSVDEGGEQKGSSVARAGHKLGTEGELEVVTIHLGADGDGGDADSIADDQRPIVPGSDGDTMVVKNCLHANVEDGSRERPSNNTRQNCNELTPRTPLGPVQYRHDERNSDSARDVTAAAEVRHRSGAPRNRCHNGAPQQTGASTTATATATIAAVATIAVVPPRTDASITVSDDSEEGRGTGTQSDTEWANDSGSEVDDNGSSALDLPGPLDVDPRRAGSAGVTQYSESPTLDFGQPQSLDISFGLRSGEVKRRRNGSLSERVSLSPPRVVSPRLGSVKDASNLRGHATVEVEEVVGHTERAPAESRASPGSCNGHRTPRGSATAHPGSVRSGEDRFDDKDSYPRDASAVEGGLAVSPSSGEDGDGCNTGDRPRFVSNGATTKSIDDENEPQHQRHHPTTGKKAPEAGVRPRLNERLLRRPSGARKDTHSDTRQTNAEVDCTSAPRPKEVSAGGMEGSLEGATSYSSSGGLVAVPVRHRNQLLSSMPTTSGDTHRGDYENSPPYRLLGVGYTEYFPKIGAILSAYHNGRALTREGDCRSLPLTSSIMARGRGGRGGATGLTSTEEEACLQLQLKLYAIYVRVIKVRTSANIALSG